MRIINSMHIGATTQHHVSRWQADHMRLIIREAAHQYLESFCGAITGLLSAVRKAGKRGRGRLAKNGVIIHAEHRHLLWNSNAIAQASIQDMQGYFIIAGPKCQRLWKCLQPDGNVSPDSICTHVVQCEVQTGTA